MLTYQPFCFLWDSSPPTLPTPIKKMFLMPVYPISDTLVIKSYIHNWHTNINYSMPGQLANKQFKQKHWCTYQNLQCTSIFKRISLYWYTRIYLAWRPGSVPVRRHRPVGTCWWSDCQWEGPSFPGPGAPTPDPTSCYLPGACPCHTTPTK